MDNVLILVDVQNVYYTTKHTFGRRFDYNALWAELSAKYNIVKAFAYAIDRGDVKQREFQNILRAIGFEVKLKPFIQRKDGSAKGDWDVGIVIDALEYCSDVDHVILLSGDGDFDLLAYKLRRDGKRVSVIGAQPLTAQSLIKACDNFIAIDESLLL